MRIDHCGYHCPVNDTEDPYVRLLWQEWEEQEDGTYLERGERINGFFECPKCELIWPCVEDPDMWEESRLDPSQYEAVRWFGHAVCCECNLLLIQQLDGTCEAYQLGEPA